MGYGVHDFAGNIGVLAILLTCLLLQTGKKAPGCTRSAAINAVGALLVLYSLTREFSLSAAVTEIVWLAISLFGIARILRMRQSGSGEQGVAR